MSGFDSERRMWQQTRLAQTAFNHSTTSPSLTPPPFATAPNPKNLGPASSGGFDGDLVAAVVPPVTVVLEGRSICQRISLHKLGSYQSLAWALRHMFMDIIITTADEDLNNNNNNNNNNNSIINENSSSSDDHRNEIILDLSNAVPGHLVAYEDMENDLLLVGDLNWKDFVRVAKRIRILPAKAKSRKKKEELN